MAAETPQPDPPDDGQLVVNRRIRIPLGEFSWTFSRSSGPGGQNVNKVSSKAQLRWDVQGTESLPADVKERFVRKYRRRMTTEGEFLISSQRYRDQPKNVDDCLGKLRELILSVAVAPKPRKKTKPGKAAKERRLREKKRRSERKQMRKRPRGEE